ncbi:hypothetical protein Aglo01_51210 [Actinokineospora globicatena]|nr:hypothetical protein Aglo01_51210 [Actinokineospora globicatena]GLW87467.1 hypothetical protein Aglo02_51060 [Actinokineospora globicatena]
MTNWSTPISADAAPASRPWSASASAVEFGLIMPMQATDTNSVTSSHTNPRSHTTAPSTPSPPTAATTNPATSSARGANHRSSSEFSWATSTIPSAFAPNTRAYCCGLNPWMSCRTNDDPEM